MAETNVPLHQEDNIVLLDTFDFSQSIFDLHEPDIQIPSLSNDFTTPTKDINLKFKNYENLIKIAHVNSCSIPKHLHEIDKIVQETDMDVIGAAKLLFLNILQIHLLIFLVIIFFMLIETKVVEVGLVCMSEMNILRFA